MMLRFYSCLIVVSSVFCEVGEAPACSVFVLEGTKFATVGRNYDWDTGNGVLIVNKRGMSKTALGLNNPIKWVSKFGSVTFNQYGRGFPCGGMNEKGLVIEVAWLDGTRYPPPDKRPMVSPLQWIQYQLDTAETVEELIASDKRLRIETFSGTRVHYVVVERSGAMATIEFLDGKMVVHHGAELPAKALTNSTYERSLASIAKDGLNSNNPPVCDGSSLSRFNCAATLASQFSRISDDRDRVDYCFDTLRRVAQGSYTKWSIVYDTKDYRIHFKTRKAKQRRFVDLDDLEFSNDTPVVTLDVNEDLSGDVSSELSEYSDEQNRAVFRQSMRETPVLSALPGVLLDNVARYPQTIKPVVDHEAEAMETESAAVP